MIEELMKVTPLPKELCEIIMSCLVWSDQNLFQFMNTTTTDKLPPKTKHDPILAVNEESKSVGLWLVNKIPLPWHSGARIERYYIGNEPNWYFYKFFSFDNSASDMNIYLLGFNEQWCSGWIKITRADNIRQYGDTIIIAEKKKVFLIYNCSSEHFGEFMTAYPRSFWIDHDFRLLLSCRRKSREK
jgi:hypothetical protein